MWLTGERSERKEIKDLEPLEWNSIVLVTIAAGLSLLFSGHSITSRSPRLIGGLGPT